MNELRRKLVLSSPLLTVGLFTGCGGGGGDGDAPATTHSTDAGRLSAQATATKPGQTLVVSALTSNTLDAIWAANSSGPNFVPNDSPSLQAVINGTALHISLVETVTLTGGVQIIKSLSMSLTAPSSGTALKAGAVYTVNGTTNTAQVRILKRTTSGTTITDQTYAYSPSASGMVKIASVTPVTGKDPLYKLTFATVKFQAVSAPAVKPFSISGDTTLSTPTETANWV